MEPRSLVEIPLRSEFSLSDTLKSGQVFQWESLPLADIEGFAGCIGESAPCWIAQPDRGTVLTLAGDEDRVARYFGLDQDVAAIHATFPGGDPVLAEAIAYCPGIRLLRQPPWECLATFITSSLKQVAHIRAISLTLRQRYGRSWELGGRSFHSYPSPGILADAGEEELRGCAIGYRARSLARAGESIRSGITELDGLRDVERSAARDRLLELHGVGEKIANCTLLFSCDHWGAFPIDVWIERVLRRLYRKRLRGARLQAWAESYFGENAGYAQQYLFHYARKTLGEGARGARK